MVMSRGLGDVYKRQVPSLLAVLPVVPGEGAVVWTAEVAGVVPAALAVVPLAAAGVVVSAAVLPEVVAAAVLPPSAGAVAVVLVTPPPPVSIIFCSRWRSVCSWLARC